MFSGFMHLAIFGRNYKGFEDYISLLFRELEKYDASVYILNSFYRNILRECCFEPKIEGVFETHQDIRDKKVDFMISMGGDGTFLQAANIVRDLGIPLIGINIGRLGFLANIPKSEISDAVRAIFNHEYTLEERAMLELSCPDSPFWDYPYALNEMTFQRHGPTMITVHVDINGEYLNSYWADGLIISTPTGSTAYSLSAGGPVISPGANNFVILPIAPHNLNVRPLVLTDDVELKIRIDARNEQFLATLDSMSEVMSSHIEMVVKKASFRMKLLNLNFNSFYATLRNKLMWGADKRN